MSTTAGRIVCPSSSVAMKESPSVPLQESGVVSPAASGGSGQETSAENLNLVSSLSWSEISAGAHIRYFSPSQQYSNIAASDIWAMGEDITCNMDDQGNVLEFSIPSNFDQSLPLKLFTHGFNSGMEKGEGEKELFVSAWMKAYQNNVNVILLEWETLAHAPGLPLAHYDEVANNSIDVGNYLGKCLARLQVRPGDIHLAGHSLGAHLVGKAGRVFAALAGAGQDATIGRITGLDPAGPRWVDGCMPAIPVLHENMLTKESAKFVDAIHTNGGPRPCAWRIVFGVNYWLGLLNNVGHFDFYVSNGGRTQYGCSSWLNSNHWDYFRFCSHVRAWQYYLHSIAQPRLFPSQPCSSVTECSSYANTALASTAAYMGEAAIQAWDGETGMFNTRITDCHWTAEGVSNSCRPSQENGMMLSPPPLRPESGSSSITSSQCHCGLPGRERIYGGAEAVPHYYAWNVFIMMQTGDNDRGNNVDNYVGNDDVMKCLQGSGPLTCARVPWWTTDTC